MNFFLLHVPLDLWNHACAHVKCTQVKTSGDRHHISWSYIIHTPPLPSASHEMANISASAQRKTAGLRASFACKDSHFLLVSRLSEGNEYSSRQIEIKYAVYELPRTHAVRMCEVMTHTYARAHARARSRLMQTAKYGSGVSSQPSKVLPLLFHKLDVSPASSLVTKVFR